MTKQLTKIGIALFISCSIAACGQRATNEVEHQEEHQNEHFDNYVDTTGSTPRDSVSLDTMNRVSPVTP